MSKFEELEETLEEIREPLNNLCRMLTTGNGKYEYEPVAANYNLVASTVNTLEAIIKREKKLEEMEELILPIEF